MNGATVLVDILNGNGVESVFCSPGSEWPPVWEELARRRATNEQVPEYLNVRHEETDEQVPEYLNVRHEETAIAMASGFAKATGNLPAVLIHTTPGTLNAGQSRTWFTHSWSRNWLVQWSVRPTASGGRVSWSERIERASNGTLTYFITVRNVGSAPTTFEAKYARLR